MVKALGKGGFATHDFSRHLSWDPSREGCRDSSRERFRDPPHKRVCHLAHDWFCKLSRERLCRLSQTKFCHLSQGRQPPWSVCSIENTQVQYQRCHPKKLPRSLNYQSRPWRAVQNQEMTKGTIAKLKQVLIILMYVCPEWNQERRASKQAQCSDMSHAPGDHTH